MNILLTQLLNSPGLSINLSDEAWDIVIPQARNTALLGSLYARLDNAGLLDKIPEKVSRHMLSAFRVHEKQQQNLMYEVKWLTRALSECDGRLILLKGAAYIVASLPVSAGRLISDIDFLVPRNALKQTEKSLNHYGWDAGEIDPYDERYYREWMHEIPPMGHEERESTIDVHHTILPPTSNTQLDSRKLFEEAVNIKNGTYALSPVDMVIHSAAHLFHEGEFTHGLRDLLDLDGLMRHFSQSEAQFWENLLPRALEFHLVKPLYYALRYCQYFFETPVPDEVILSIKPYSPGKFHRSTMDYIFIRAFMPDHASCHLAWTGLARYFLYVRSHYLRMPLHLLVPHLLKKWRRGRLVRNDASATDVDNTEQ